MPSHRLLFTVTLALMLMLVFPLYCAAQSKVIPVRVTHSGADKVGAQIAYELREAIRASHGMRLTDDTRKPHITIKMVTIDAEIPRTDLSSAIAVSVAYDSIDTPMGGLLMTTIVYLYGRDNVASCVKDILAV